MNEKKLEKMSTQGYQLIVGIISVEILNGEDQSYNFQLKLEENDKILEEKKPSNSFKKLYETAEAHKFNYTIKSKSTLQVGVQLLNDGKLVGKITIPLVEVPDERVNSENVIKEYFITKEEDKIAVFKMRLALRKNRNLVSYITDEQMLDTIQNSAAQRLESVKNMEHSRDSFENISLYPTKVNPPRKSIYQLEIESIDQKLQTVQQGSDVYKKLIKERKLQEKKEKKRIEKNEKILKLYNLPKEETLVSRYFAGHITNKTTWMSRVGNFYLTQNYLCFKQQLLSFMLTIPLFSMKKVVFKSKTINFDFNGNEYVVFERGLSKRMIKLIEEQLQGYSQNGNNPPPVIETKNSVLVFSENEDKIKEAFLGERETILDEKDLITEKEDRDESTMDSDEDEFGTMLSKEPSHVAFIPDDILEQVVESREFNVSAIKFFYILFGDNSHVFQDYLIYKGGSSEMVTSKWGNRENEIGSWRQLDYIAPVPPLPFCPTSTRTNRTQYFYLTKEKLIFEERLTMFDVYFGEKFQVGNRIVAVTNGKKCTVSVQSGVIFLTKVWGWVKTTIINNSRKSAGGEMRGVLDAAQVAVEEFNTKRNEEARKGTIQRKASVPVPFEGSSNKSLKVELPQTTNVDEKTFHNEIDKLDKKLASVTKELEATKAKLVEIQKAVDPLYQRIFYVVVLVILLYLLFFKR